MFDLKEATTALHQCSPKNDPVINLLVCIATLKCRYELALTERDKEWEAKALCAQLGATRDLEHYLTDRVRELPRRLSAGY
jgi:hypothetical protein